MEDGAVELDGEACAWMVRRLPEMVSCIYLHEDLVIAGDWSGFLSCWSKEGDQRWKFNGPDRVSSIVIVEERIIATMGLELISLSLDDGSLMWRHELEGSADEVRVSPDGETIHATSSVFDIEHGDFMESAYWRFNFDGDLIAVNKFDERPWHISVSEERVILGLGRPRCGMLVYDGDDEKWLELVEDDPVSCGAQAKKATLFGHSKGSLTKVDGEEIRTISNLGKGINKVIPTKVGLAVLDEEGGLHILDDEGRVLSESIEKSFNEITDSFSPGGGEHAIWVSDNESIHAMDMDCQILLSITVAQRPSALVSRGDTLALGLADGTIYLFVEELLQRRFGATSEPSEGDDSLRRILRERLRRLRE